MNGKWYLMQYLKQVGGGMGKYISASFQMSVGAGQTLRVSQDIGYSKVLLQTIKILPASPTSLEFVIVSDPAAALTDLSKLVYDNTSDYSTGNTTDGIYDIVNIPYIDSTLLNHLHVGLTNKGSTTIVFTVTIQAFQITR